MPGWFEQISCDLGAAWAIARKDMKIYYIKPSILVSSLLFPFVMFLAFAIGRNAPAGTLLPGLLAITLLFSASSIEPVSIPIERRTKTFDRLLAAQVSVRAIVLPPGNHPHRGASCRARAHLPLFLDDGHALCRLPHRERG